MVALGAGTGMWPRTRPREKSDEEAFDLRVPHLRRSREHYNEKEKLRLVGTLGRRDFRCAGISKQIPVLPVTAF